MLSPSPSACCTLRSCIQEWIKQQIETHKAPSCPMCRKDVEKASLIDPPESDEAQQVTWLACCAAVLDAAVPGADAWCARAARLPAPLPSAACCCRWQRLLPPLPACRRRPRCWCHLMLLWLAAPRSRRCWAGCGRSRRSTSRCARAAFAFRSNVCNLVVATWWLLVARLLLPLHAGRGGRAGRWHAAAAAGQVGRLQSVCG